MNKELKKLINRNYPIVWELEGVLLECRGYNKDRKYGNSIKRMEELTSFLSNPQYIFAVIDEADEEVEEAKIEKLRAVIKDKYGYIGLGHLLLEKSARLEYKVARLEKIYHTYRRFIFVSSDLKEVEDLRIKFADREEQCKIYHVSALF